MELTESVSNKMHEVGNHLISLAHSGPPGFFDIVGPFCMDALHCAMVSFHWLHREGGNQAFKTSLNGLANCLVMLGKRWTLGQAYLALADRYDAFNKQID
jgi:hypothetical protein